MGHYSQSYEDTAKEAISKPNPSRAIARSVLHQADFVFLLQDISVPPPS